MGKLKFSLEAEALFIPPGNLNLLGKDFLNP